MHSSKPKLILQIKSFAGNGVHKPSYVFYRPKNVASLSRKTLVNIKVNKSKR